MAGTPANSLNLTTAGLVKFDGTSVFSAVTTTNHSVLVGAASNGITSLTAGITNQVLLGNTGADPSFGSVPAGALPGSGAVTLSNGTNISITGSPLSLGGTATFNVSGPPSATTLTQNGVLYGNGTSAIGATSAGTTNQVLLGNTGSAPSFGSVPNAALSNSSLTLASGNNITVSGSPVSLGGTATINVSGTTANCVQVGSGSGSLTSITNGNTGQLFQANTNTIPTWTTATFPSTAGTSGNVLTSDGTNWISSPATGGVSPNATLNLFDDFIGNGVVTASNLFCSGLTWLYPSVLKPSATTNTSSANPGIITWTILSATQSVYIILANGSTSSGTFILGGGAITLTWIFKLARLSTSSNRYILRCGLGDTVSSSDQANGVYFEYSDNVNSGSWVGKTASGSTRSIASSAVAASTTGFNNFQISINADASSVAYYINGVQISNSPLSANIPTSAISPFFQWIVTTGTIPDSTFFVDLFSMTQTLTTAR